MNEAHKSKCSIHPGATKMYQDLREDYWWPCMKQDVARYVEEYLTCRKVKAKHQRPHGKLQPLEIPEWKWEHLTMDFITKLPITQRGVDAIWVIEDRLTKSAHFLPIQEKNSSAEKLADIFVREIVIRHGEPVSIVSDRDTRFTARFWVLGCVSVRNFTHRRMGRASVRLRHSRICFELVSWILEVVGIDISHWQSSPITTATTLALVDHHLKCYMGGSVERPSVGARLGIEYWEALI
ncbi:hypothetical protein L2E82_45297 [Cichorium intybus]|uniref:Uncharacterized protein n=1 Tax=Cichorium intybus TaxID=13427 RepID=A0ACB8ZX01_CICIN|nr:hypothetical protein L2E82_45297 [Cichorium intybus]